MKMALKDVFLFGFLTFMLLSYGQKNNVDRLFKNAVKHIEIGNIDSSEFYFDTAINLQKEQQPDSLRKIFFAIGCTYHQYFKLDLSKKYLLIALDQTIKYGNAIQLSDAYIELGVVFYDQQNYAKALNLFKEALIISTDNNDSVGVGIVHNNIGLIYMDTKDYETAIGHFHKAISFLDKTKNALTISKAFNNIGIAEYQSMRYEKSIGALKKAKSFNQKNYNETQSGNIDFNMALSYYDMGNFDEALTRLNKAISKYKAVNYSERVLLCEIHLYRLYYQMGKLEMAKYYEQKALSGIDTIQHTAAKVDLYSYLSNNYLAEGDSITALNYSLVLLNVGKEVLAGLENQNLIRLKSDVAYVDISNELSTLVANHSLTLNKNKEILQMNSQLNRLNKWVIILSVGSFILLLFIIILLSKSNQKKRKNNQVLAQQKQELKIKNNQILNSVSYANSMEKLLLQQMNPHFIFNALTTVEASIAVGEVDFAKSYISMFADLLRKTLDYSRKDSVALTDEIDFLQSYIELNSIKQGDDFSYEFLYDKDKAEDFVYTPPMLVQPFIENALIHGLYHKTDGEKRLKIEVSPKEDHIIWVIEDNGVGRQKSQEIGKTHKGVSHGIKITSDRIKWMENIYGHQFSITYSDLEQGTSVTLKTPIVEK